MHTYNFELVGHVFLLQGWTEEDKLRVLSLKQSPDHSSADRMNHIDNAQRKLAFVGVKILETIKAVLVYVFV